MRRRGVLIATVACLGALLIFLMIAGRQLDSAELPGRATPEEAPLTAEASPGALPPTGVPSPDGSAASARRRMTPADRARLAQRLERARTERQAAAHPDAAPPGPSADGAEPTVLSLTDKTGDNTPREKRIVGTLNELMGSCYDLARHDDPALAGNFGIGFRLVGEPDVGGLLEDVTVDPAYTTLESPAFHECARESLHALALDPPPSGTSVGRQLTMRFAPPDAGPQ